MNRKLLLTVFLAVIIACLFFLRPDQRVVYSEEAGWKEYQMTYSTDEQFLGSIKTFDPKFYSIENYIWLANLKDKNGFQCITGNDFIKVDTDGDGQIDKTLQSKENLIDYKLDYGTVQQSYRAKIWQVKTMPGQKIFWYYRRAGFMKGTVEGEPVILIDDNSNGRYNDFGQDALLIGRGKEAGLLSFLVFIKGKYYEFRAEQSGTSFWLREYQGALGKIDVKSKLNFKKVKPPNFIILANKDTYLPISTKEKTAVAPVGEYKLYLAVLTDRIRVRHGNLPLIKIEADQVTVLGWGEPFKLVCEPRLVKGGEVMGFIEPKSNPPTAPEFPNQKLDCPFIKMNLPKVYGQNGEEYFGDPEMKDQAGYCFPDIAVTYFNVEISAKETVGKIKKGKLINKIGKHFVDNWQQLNPSGIVEKRIPWWTIYQCPMNDYRGPVTVKVWIKSGLFGDLIFEQDLMVKEE